MGHTTLLAIKEEKLPKHAHGYKQLNPVPAILEPFKLEVKNDASGTDPFLITEENVPDSLRTMKLLVDAKELHKHVLYLVFFFFFFFK